MDWDWLTDYISVDSQIKYEASVPLFFIWLMLLSLWKLKSISNLVKLPPPILFPDLSYQTYAKH